MLDLNAQSQSLKATISVSKTLLIWRPDSLPVKSFQS